MNVSVFEKKEKLNMSIIAIDMYSALSRQKMCSKQEQRHIIIAIIYSALSSKNFLPKKNNSPVISMQRHDC